MGETEGCEEGGWSGGRGRVPGKYAGRRRREGEGGGRRSWGKVVGGGGREEVHLPVADVDRGCGGGSRQLLLRRAVRVP